LLKDFVVLWLDQVCESELSRSGYLQCIEHFGRWALENHGLRLREIPSSWRASRYGGAVEVDRFLDGLKDVLKDYFTHVRKTYSPMSVNRMMSTVMSYLHAYEIPVKPIRLKHSYVQYHNRDITKEELRRILDHSDLRNRAIFLVLYESGMRPNTLINLKWKHVKDEFLSHRIPMMIKLTSDIMKCHVVERWTFIGEEAFEALKKHVSCRLPLREDDLVFVKEKPQGGQFGVTALSQAFNRIVKKLNLAEHKGLERKKPKELRLYCLRKAFRKYMASSIDSRYVEFWMGHTNTETHYLSTDIEHHRELYSKGYENLRLYKPEVDAETIAKLARENMDLKQRVERLENVLRDIAELKEQLKREEDRLLG